MLRDTIKQEVVKALKAGDERRVETLRFLVSLLDKRALDLPVGAMKDEEELAVLRKELKHKEEAKEMFVKGERSDLVAETDYEIEVLREYLPPEINDEEIRKVVTEIVGNNSGANFGMVMGMVMKRLAGQVSGDRVASIVKECLT